MPNVSSVLSRSLLRHRRPARHLAVLHRGGITGRHRELAKEGVIFS